MSFLLVGTVCLLIGYALCYFSIKPPAAKKTETETLLVKRAKPSLRNPMRTYNVAYDEYKTQKGLYAPVKPKSEKKEEIEVGR